MEGGSGVEGGGGGGEGRGGEGRGVVKDTIQNEKEFPCIGCRNHVFVHE